MDFKRRNEMKEDGYIGSIGKPFTAWTDHATRWGTGRNMMPPSCLERGSGKRRTAKDVYVADEVNIWVNDGMDFGIGWGDADDGLESDDTVRMVSKPGKAVTLPMTTPMTTTTMTTP
ncbi:hypothetical protein VP1G_11065 [Cytospora mali]|uniref:Uncharacterized protein n=1 Tax=Cytospora mali TaxID=578113 RepID=A0A194V3M2_CYTMA|nr:hypothetical protein VP1G_11065 [Valsa mali var. pyri (nom. inval.)]